MAKQKVYETFTGPEIIELWGAISRQLEKEAEGHKLLKSHLAFPECTVSVQFRVYSPANQEDVELNHTVGPIMAPDQIREEFLTSNETQENDTKRAKRKNAA